MIKRIFISIILIIIFSSCLFAKNVVGLKESEFNWKSNSNIVDRYVDDNLTRTWVKQRFEKLKDIPTSDLYKKIRNVEKKIDRKIEKGELTENDIKKYTNEIEDLEYDYYDKFVYLIACINIKLEDTGLAFKIDTVNHEFYTICNNCRKKLYPEYIALVDYDQLIKDLGNRANSIDKNALRLACNNIENGYRKLDTPDMRYLQEQIRNSKGLNSNKISINIEEMALSQAIDCQEQINDFYGNILPIIFELLNKSINELNPTNDIKSIETELSTIKELTLILKNAFYDTQKNAFDNIDNSINLLDNECRNNKIYDNGRKAITNISKNYKNIENNLVDSTVSYGTIEKELKNINSILANTKCRVYLEDDSKYFSYSQILDTEWVEYNPYAEQVTINLTSLNGRDLNNELISKLRSANRYNPNGLISKNINFNNVYNSFNGIEKAYVKFKSDFYNVSYIKSIENGKGISIAQEPFIEVAKSEANDLIEEFNEGGVNISGLEDYLREINNELEDINVKVVIDSDVYTKKYANILDKKINWIYPKTTQEKKKIESEKKKNTKLATSKNTKVVEHKNIRKKSNNQKRNNNNKVDTARRTTKKDNKTKIDNKNKQNTQVQQQKAKTNKAAKQVASTKRKAENEGITIIYDTNKHLNNKRSKNKSKNVIDTIKQGFKDL